jgi:dephospho-CoA kinase
LAHEQHHKPSPFVLGIAGTYCSGKTTLAHALEQELLARDVPVLHIEVDHLGHQVLEQVHSQLLERFGPEVLIKDSGDGPVRVNRPYLGSLVFASSQAMVDLEAIVHPPMVQQVDQLIQNHPNGVVVLNAAILFKMRLDTRCRHIVGVDAPRLIRLVRAMGRDRLTFKEAWKRIQAQKEILPKLSVSNADIARVSNWGGKKSLDTLVQDIVRELWKQIEITS